MNGWADYLDELLDVKSGLTDWEVAFIEDLARNRRRFPSWEPTDNQLNKLIEIYEEHC